MQSSRRRFLLTGSASMAAHALAQSQANMTDLAAAADVKQDKLIKVGTINHVQAEQRTRLHNGGALKKGKPTKAQKKAAKRERMANRVAGLS